jgi:uncharacterized alkaline shock family protein YloU
VFHAGEPVKTEMEYASDKVSIRIEKIENPEGFPKPMVCYVADIYIEDITTEDERSEAKTQRENYGKHVIPAPALELKRSFAGYFLDSLGLFKGRFRHQNEKTVVRPSFSYIGEYVLSEKVISDIVKLVAEEDKAISGVIMVTQDPSPGNYVVNAAVRITSACSLWDDMQRFQQKVKDAVEQMTAFNVAEVNVEVRGIEYHGRY